MRYTEPTETATVYICETIPALGIAMDSQDVLALVLVYAIIAASVALSFYLDRKGTKLDVRKIVHIGVGNFVFVWWMFSANWIMLVFFAVPFALALLYIMLKKEDKSELGKISNKMGHPTGLFLYVVSICILVAFFFDHWLAASVAIVAMTYGDGFGSVIGRKYGKHKHIRGKSFEGSLAVFAMTAIVGFVVCLLYTFLNDGGWWVGDVSAIIPLWACCLVAGAIASVAESVCPGEVDNLVIPMLVAVALVALGL